MQATLAWPHLPSGLINPYVNHGDARIAECLYSVKRFTACGISASVLVDPTRDAAPMAKDSDYSFGRIDRQPAVAKRRRRTRANSTANPYTTRDELKSALAGRPDPSAGSILVTGCYGLQATLIRDRKRHSRYFALSRYGFDASRTHAAASAWLADLDSELPPLTRIRNKPVATKTSDLPNGVSIARHKQYRRGVEAGRWISVDGTYHDGIKTRHKSFYIGNEASIEPWLLEEVCELVIKFRTEAETARRSGRVFDVTAWKAWHSKLSKAAYDELRRISPRRR
ncbi:hypothetical protein ACS8Y6_17680 [Salinisphaera sp. RV14]|uniref:hypothetical protein n=1 Tax=Salinisphaera sp. RV14 TaxID=3454140 RepID=UPI003F8461D3